MILKLAPWMLSLLFAFEAGAQNLNSRYQSDLSKCENSRKQAELCCGDPMSCASGLSPAAKQQLIQLAGMGAMAAMSMMKNKDIGISPEGMMGICSMLSALGSAGGGVNNGAADVCEKTRSACSTACSGTIQFWEQQKASCAGNCADASLIETAVSEFQSRSSTCEGLSANTESMRSQGQQTSGAGDLGQFCQQIASMMAQNQKKAQNVIDCNLPENATNPLCIDCKADPENKQCGQVQTENNNSSLSFADSSSTTANDFNTGAGIDGLSQDPKFGAYEPKANQSGTVGGQGGGGGMMGGGNNGGGFGTDPMPTSEEGGYNTNVLAGERGGSGYSSPVGAPDGSGGFSGYGSTAASEEEMPYAGMDLKKFLPGGDMDPSRRLAGALVNSGQINAKNEDIFQRISTRIKAVCLTNRLKDCQKR